MKNKLVINYDMLSKLVVNEASLYSFVNSFPNGITIPVNTIEVKIHLDLVGIFLRLQESKILKDITIIFIEDDNLVIKNNFWESHQYDSHGNMIKYENAYGEINTFTYDQNNNKIKKIEEYDGYWKEWKYNSNKKPLSSLASDGNWEKWEYNNKGEFIKYTCSYGTYNYKSTKIEFIKGQ